MADDSDSDDSLLGYNAVPRRKRTETKKIANGFALLDDAMGHADRIFEHDELMHKIKQENAYNDQDDDGDDGALRKKNEQILAEFHKPKAATTTQDRDSIFTDLENVLTKERCIDLGKAMDVDLTSPLGVRRTIAYDPTRQKRAALMAENDNGNDYYFDKETSVAAYISRLKACLRKHVSSKHKSLQLACIQPLRKASTAKNSDGSKYMELKLLLEQAFLAKQRKIHNVAHIPEDILLWLFRVACSPECISVGLRHGAYESLRVLLRQNQFFMKKKQEESAKENNEDDNEAITTFQLPHFLNLSQLAIQLQSWVILPVEKVPPGSLPAAQANTGNDNSNVMHESNSLGLERLLMIWSTAFQSEQVSARQGEDGAKDATRCMTLLAKALVDSSVQDTTRTHSLRDNLQIVISKLLEFTSIRLTDGDDAKLVEWMKETSQAILVEMDTSNLGPGIHKDDEEDEEALLTYSLLCRLLPYTCHDTDRRFHARFQKSAAMFKSIFSMHALHFVFLEEDARETREVAVFQKRWEDQVCSLVGKCQTTHKVNCDFVGKAESLPWLALCSSLVATRKLNDLRSNLQEYACLCLAAVEMGLGSCLHAGMELLKGTTKEVGNDDSEYSVMKEYGSVEQARAVTHLLSMLKIECADFISRTGVLSTFNLLFQRASYFVQSNNKYFGDTLGFAARAGGEKGEPLQTTMQGYFAKRSSPTNIKEEAGNEDEHDEEATHPSPSPTKKQRLAIVEEPQARVAVAGEC